MIDSPTISRAHRFVVCELQEQEDAWCRAKERGRGGGKEGGPLETGKFRNYFSNFFQASADGGADSADPLARINEAVGKRIRNLEKRQSKLDSYEKELLKGKSLTSEQKEALSKLPDVLLQLEQLKDLKDNFSQIIKDSEKLVRARV